MSKTIETEHVVHLGNPAPRRPVTEGGEVVGYELFGDGPDVTTWKLEEGCAEELLGHAEEIRELAARKGSTLAAYILSEHRLAPWEVALKHVFLATNHHHDRPASWISTEDGKLEDLLRVLLPFAEAAPKGTSAALKLAHLEGDPEQRADILSRIPAHEPTALKTEEGLALINGNAFGPTQVALAEYVALTANNVAESAANTSLAGEIVTSGLKRKKAGVVTTKGVSTITVTFTAAAADVPVEVHKFGIFNKVTSGGTMVIETKITTAAFNAENDNMALTETITTT